MLVCIFCTAHSINYTLNYTQSIHALYTRSTRIYNQFITHKQCSPSFFFFFFFEQRFVKKYFHGYVQLPRPPPHKSTQKTNMKWRWRKSPCLSKESSLRFIGVQFLKLFLSPPKFCWFDLLAMGKRKSINLLAAIHLT